MLARGVTTQAVPRVTPGRMTLVARAQSGGHPTPKGGGDAGVDFCLLQRKKKKAENAPTHLRETRGWMCPLGSKLKGWYGILPTR